MRCRCHKGKVAAGRVSDLERSTAEGFAKGSITLTGLGGWQDQQAHVQFQNENLLLEMEGQPRAIVPDLICCLDTQSGTALWLLDSCLCPVPCHLILLAYVHLPGLLLAC